MTTILPISHRTCLFCGEQIEGRWQESDRYYECECPDSVLHRKLTEQIDELKKQLPQEKFTITSEPILRRKNNIL